MSYRITVLNGRSRVKTIDQDEPPTDRQLQQLERENPSCIVDVCRLDPSEEDFDYRFDSE